MPQVHWADDVWASPGEGKLQNANYFALQGSGRKHTPPETPCRGNCRAAAALRGAGAEGARAADGIHASLRRCGEGAGEEVARTFPGSRQVRLAGRAAARERQRRAARARKVAKKRGGSAHLLRGMFGWVPVTMGSSGGDVTYESPFVVSTTPMRLKNTVKGEMLHWGDSRVLSLTKTVGMT